MPPRISSTLPSPDINRTRCVTERSILPYCMMMIDGANWYVYMCLGLRIICLQSPLVVHVVFRVAHPTPRTLHVYVATFQRSMIYDTYNVIPGTRYLVCVYASSVLSADRPRARDQTAQGSTYVLLVPCRDILYPPMPPPTDPQQGDCALWHQYLAQNWFLL